MMWTALMLYSLTSVFASNTDERVPFFRGHVSENSPPGSKVNGLSIPLERVDAQGLCGRTGAHLQLRGLGSEDFHVFVHYARGHVLLKTSKALDRERRAHYLLALALGACCPSCRPAAAAATEVARVEVDVLDTNDHEPTFPGADVKISVEDATALRSVVLQVAAADGDSGENAELMYFALPRNSSFYVVPKTGEVLLVDSILGFDDPIRFEVFAKDRGRPSRTSRSLAVEIIPRRWSWTQPPRTRASAVGPRRRSRSLLDSDSPVVVSVSEDAGIGSVVVNLNPVKFQAATFELISPGSENSPVSVGRDSGDIVIARRLDRETEPVLEIIVKIQDKRDSMDAEISDVQQSFALSRYHQPILWEPSTLADFNSRDLS